MVPEGRFPFAGKNAWDLPAQASLNLDKCICVDYPMTLHSICVRGRNGLLQLARSLAEAPEQYRTNIVMVDFVEKFHALFSDFASPVNEVLLDGASYTIRLGGSTTIVDIVISPALGLGALATLARRRLSGSIAAAGGALAIG